MQHGNIKTNKGMAAGLQEPYIPAPPAPQAPQQPVQQVKQMPHLNW